MTSKADKSPALPPSSTTPVLKSKNYTTGRGGTGNIVKNDNPEVARKAQDVDVPGITLPENEYHTGRGESYHPVLVYDVIMTGCGAGGVGNLYKPTDEELAANRENNQQVRSASFSKDRGGLKGLADKAKDLVKGNSSEEK